MNETTQVRVSVGALWAVPPLPKVASGLTSREYRAARRGYRRLRDRIKRGRRS